MRSADADPRGRRLKAADGRIATSPVIPLKTNGDDVTTTGAPLLGLNYPPTRISRS